MRPLLLAAFAGLVVAQSSSSSQTTSLSTSTNSSTFPVSLSLTTASATITTSIRSNGVLTQFQTVVPTIFNVTLTLTPTATSTSSSSTSTDPAASTETSPAPIVLDTRVDPAFGVLGAILIITGLPSAFWGHKNRWTSFFLIGFYTLSLSCAVLIIRFGVLPAVNPPNRTLRGMFVLASTIAGIAGGGISIFFWKGARYGIGAWGGFALALWIQCFRNGGIIRPIGYRWILNIGMAVVGFTLSTIPKIHYHVLLISTAFVGSSAFVLGVDCYTTAGLKEFYMWNLGFRSLFPKYTTNGIQFPVSQTMQIELGIIGAVALMGIAVQLRIMRVLKKKLKEIAEEARKHDEEAELQAASRFINDQQDRDAWEKEHPLLGKRQESTTSTMPLMMKDRDGSASPATLTDSRQRHMSGLSDFKFAPAPEEELRRSRLPFMQNPALPALDLGLGIKEDVPASFITQEKEPLKLKEMTVQELEALKKKEELVAEIQNIRKSIEILKSETTISPSPPSQSRRPSLVSRRTLSIDASAALLPPVTHARPPRETDPRGRVHSLEFSTLAATRSPPLGAVGEAISRPTSVPLQDANWEAYIQERKLLQPPSGVTPPIVPSPAPRVPMSTAVQEALEKRKRRESQLGLHTGGSRSASGTGSVGEDNSEDVPLAKIASSSREKKLSVLAGVTGLGNAGYSTTGHRNSASGQGVTILPPRRSSTGNILAPVPQPGSPKGPVVKTFEELNERHREKIKNLQEPVTRAEKESADVRNAKERWERARRAEKETMLRKHADLAAVADKEKRQNKEEENAKRHTRALSTDRLAGSSSRRLSVLKVEDWQRYQASTTPDPVAAPEREDGEPRRKRDSVPFPGQLIAQSRSHQRSKSKDYLT